MSNDDIHQEMRDMFEQAEAYARIAIKHFLLDPSLEKQPETDKMSEFVNLVANFAHADPATYMRIGYLPMLIVHFLFPNLSDEERNVIVNLSLYTESILLNRVNGREHEKSSMWNIRIWKENFEKVRSFEVKLTALQIALIDSLFCNPDSNVEFA